MKTKGKKVTGFAVCLAALACGFAAAAQESPVAALPMQEKKVAPLPVEGYTLTIKTEPKNPQPGEMVQLVLALTNVSKEDKTILSANSLLV